MPESPDSPGRKGSILGFGSVVFSNTSKCSHWDGRNARPLPIPNKRLGQKFQGISRQCSAQISHTHGAGFRDMVRLATVYAHWRTTTDGWPYSRIEHHGWANPAENRQDNRWSDKIWYLRREMRRNPRHRRGREGLDWRTHTHLWHNDYHCGDHGHGYAIHTDMIKKLV